MTKLFHTTQSDLTKYNGTAVTVLHELDETEYDKADVGQMYKIRFFDGLTADAFEDELLPYDPYNDSAVVCLCETVFDLALDLGYSAAKDPRILDAVDPRDLFHEVLKRAIEFERNFDEEGGDYLLEVSELCGTLLIDLRRKFGKEHPANDR